MLNGYAYVAVMASGDMAGISISISEGISAKQRSRYAYVSHVLTGHNTDITISIRRTLMLMLMSQPSPLAHKLLLFILMLMLARKRGPGLTSDTITPITRTNG